MFLKGKPLDEYKGFSYRLVKVAIEKGGKEVDAKRILGVMGLGVKCGEEITLRTDGDQEDTAMETLSKFLETNL